MSLVAVEPKEEENRKEHSSRVDKVGPREEPGMVGGSMGLAFRSQEEQGLLPRGNGIG